MSASAYLIIIVGLAAFFAAGVFVGARLEYSNPRIATLAYRVGLLAGYAAGMVAFGWLMYDFILPQMEKVAAVIGDGWMVVIVASIGAIAGIWSFIQHRRHPEWSINYRRQDSGKFLEPRDP